MKWREEEILKENARRWEERNRVYNPYTGEGCDEQERVRVSIPDFDGTPVMYLPKPMLRNELVQSIIRAGGIKKLIKKKKWDDTPETYDEIFKSFIRVRIYFDFPFWCVIASKLKKKGKTKNEPFVLNRPQRRTLKKIWPLIEKNMPIRLVILKARQWGGSTFIEHLAAFIQLVRKRQWHFVICAHVESASRGIRGMYTKLLRNYPAYLLGSGNTEALKFTPYEGSTKTRQIEERECRVSIGSSERPDGLRSEDVSMAHLSEVALWKATEGTKPEDLVQTLVGSITFSPLSMICYESTAKGTGNFFHREFLRAYNGESNFIAIFMGWQEKEDCVLPIDDYSRFIQSLDEYERHLFTDLGATLEHIHWYREGRRQMADDWRWKSENPSDWQEAFQTTGARVFRIEDVNRLRQNCVKPCFIGDITAEEQSGEFALSNINIYSKDRGDLWIWEMPDMELYDNRYVVIVDVGKGQTAKADFSDILVLDRLWMADGGVPEVVAEWHGHIDMDLLAWKAAQIASYYQNALLVIESNTLETANVKGDSDYILDELAICYDNLYRRPQTLRPGFQTNPVTKKAALIELNKHLRESDQYIERNALACDEFDTYEETRPGVYNAVEGNHDDRVMTRVIGMYICYKTLAGVMPAKVTAAQIQYPNSKAAGMATF